eukprot:scaffold13780_cov91-Skeletonema_marinoi.AAC.1
MMGKLSPVHRWDSSTKRSPVRLPAYLNLIPIPQYVQHNISSLTLDSLFTKSKIEAGALNLVVMVVDERGGVPMGSARRCNCV